VRRALIPLIAASLLAAPALAACGPEQAPAAAGPRIVAAFAPLQYAVDQVSSSAAIGLTPARTEPHDLELSAEQVAQIADADLVVYAKGFQPAVDEAVAQQAADRAIDVTSLVTPLNGPEGADPHVWLDPENMSAIAGAVATRLDALDPGHASAYDANAAALTAQMTALDAEFRTGLATCAQRTMVVSHDAFGYLARAYDLTQAGISGLSPEAEPSPARIKDITDLVNRLGITTIYYETLVDPKVAQTIADETGATAVVLDPIEGSTDGRDYPAAMRANLQTLRTGQQCT